MGSDRVIGLPVGQVERWLVWSGHDRVRCCLWLLRMECHVLLRYPNGRVHAASVSSPDARAGFEFELYGRRWRTTGALARTGRRRPVEGMFCVCIEQMAGEAAARSERGERES